MGEIKCESCEFSNWNYDNSQCRQCIAFNKWIPLKKKKKPPKPIYIGHRKDNI